MIADHARQAEQLERNLEIEVAHILGDRGAFGVLALAQLEIRPEPADLAFDRQPGFGIVAECFGGAVLRPQPAGLREGAGIFALGIIRAGRSEEHTSELQSLMRISYAVFCLKNKKTPHTTY